MSISRFASYNLLGQVLPITVSLVTMPLFVQAIGLERYGILSICWLLLGYFGVLDLGLGRAAGQRIAALRDQPDEARAEVFWTVFWINAGLGVAAFLLVGPLLKLGFGLQDASPLVKGELALAIPWLAASVGVSLLVGPWGAALIARERFGVYNITETVANVSSSVVPLTLAWTVGPRLDILVAASLGVRVAASLIYLFLAAKAVPLGRPTRPRKQVARSLAVYGGWITVSSIIGPLLWQWDRFAIGAVISAAAVSLYVIPFQLVWRISVIPAALSVALMPRMSSHNAEGALALHDQALRTLLSILTPIILGLTLIIEPFIRLWLGNELGRQTVDVAHILLPGLWMNSLAQVGSAYLLGQNRPGTMGRLHLAELIPYAAVLYLLMMLFGVEGAALAWTLRVVIDAVLILRFSAGNYRALRVILIPATLIVGLSLLSIILPVNALARWFLGGLLLLAGTVWAVRASPAALRAAVQPVIDKGLGFIGERLGWRT